MAQTYHIMPITDYRHLFKNYFVFSLLAGGGYLSGTAQPSDCRVTFHLNHADNAQAPAEILVKPGRVMDLSQKPLPTRDGYRFAGWYTDPDCPPETEWLFGKKSGGFFAQALDSMPVTQNLTLYARWVAPKHIANVQDLLDMRNDLYGWYVLDKDIDLKNLDDWLPIGTYEADYEYADGEWWVKSFKGKLDGQGHRLKNLKLSTHSHEKKAFFGGMANGEICNLVLDSPVIDLHTSSVYIAPLVGIMKQDGGRTAAIRHVRVKNLNARLTLNHTEPAFCGLTGITVGAWNGTLENCHVDGQLQVTVNDTGGGELYIGAIAGENYSQTRQCRSNLKVNVRFNRPETSKPLKVFIGGLVASATDIENCVSQGNISVQGHPRTDDLYIGGIVGSERYGSVSHCLSDVQISVSDAPKAQVGGIVGEFNRTYGGIGAALGMKATTLSDCYAGGKVTFDRVGQTVQGAISGSGLPQPLSAWGGRMDYRIEHCRYYLPTATQPLADAEIDTFIRLDKPLNLKKN